MVSHSKSLTAIEVKCKQKSNGLILIFPVTIISMFKVYHFIARYAIFKQALSRNDGVFLILIKSFQAEKNGLVKRLRQISWDPLHD